MQKLFVSYKIAKKLKEKGFNEPCFGWYTIEEDEAKTIFVSEKQPKQDVGICLAPIYQQVIDWFRNKNIRIVEAPTNFKDSWLVVLDFNYSDFYDKKDTGFMSLEHAIKESIKLLK